MMLRMRSTVKFSSDGRVRNNEGLKGNKIGTILRVYKAKIKAVYQVEKKVARRRNKLTKHTKKWEKLLAYAYVGL